MNFSHRRRLVDIACARASEGNFAAGIHVYIHTYEVYTYVGRGFASNAQGQRAPISDALLSIDSSCTAAAVATSSECLTQAKPATTRRGRTTPKETTQTVFTDTDVFRAPAAQLTPPLAAYRGMRGCC